MIIIDQKDNIEKIIEDNKEQSKGLSRKLSSAYWKSFGYVGGVIMPCVLTMYLAGEAAFRYEGLPDDKQSNGSKIVSCVTCHIGEREKHGYVPRGWLKDLRESYSKK